MVDLDNLTKAQRTILNAFVVAGIASFSAWTATSGIPTTQELWIGFVAGMLTLLIRIKDFLDHEEEEENCKPKMKIGMVI